MSKQALDASQQGPRRPAPNYPYLFHRWSTDHLSFRQLAVLPEADGVSRQAIQKEFLKPEWKAQKAALEQAHNGRRGRSDDAAEPPSPVVTPTDFRLPGKPAGRSKSGNAEEEGARRVLEAQRQEVEEERRRVDLDIQLLDRIQAGKASAQEIEMALGVNRDTVLDARRKLQGRLVKLREMERKVWNVESQMRDIDQFLPIVKRRAVPTMPDAED